MALSGIPMAPFAQVPLLEPLLVHLLTCGTAGVFIRQLAHNQLRGGQNLRRGKTVFRRHDGHDLDQLPTFIDVELLNHTTP